MADLLWSEIELPQQKTVDDGEDRGLPFPAVLVPNPAAEPDLGAFLGALRGGENRARIDELLRSTGAVLLRGFPVSTALEFNDVVEAFGCEDFPYTGGLALRNQVVGRIYTANEARPDQCITFHHELFIMPNLPSKIFFFCEVEPGSGGETAIVPSHWVYEKIAAKYPDFVREVEDIGLLYTYFVVGDDNHSSFLGRSWQSTYSTTDKSIAEERAAQRGIKIEWINGGAKTIVGPISGTRFIESKGRKVWMNGLAFTLSLQYNEGSSSINAVTLGNGKPLPYNILEDTLRMQEEDCVAVPWKKGDVMLLDNLTVMHSRRPFCPPRRILVSLGK